MAARLGLTKTLQVLAENHLPTIGMLNAFPAEFGFASGSSKKAVAPAKLTQEGVDARADLLMRSGHDSRQALSKWRAVEDRYFQDPRNTAFWIEEAALNLREVVLLDDEDPLDFLDTVEQSSEERLEAAKKHINDIASKIKASSSQLFTPESSSETSTSTTPADSDAQRQQLETLSKVICGDMELRIQPYEWVYDGLKPLFLDSIFDIKKGIHISLAALYCAVGRRLECPILPELASRAPITGAPAGLSLAVAPAPDPWLLRIAAGKTPSKYFLDPTIGKILTSEECKQQYADLDQSGRDWPLPFWIGLLRTAMTAHQRRGDGDAVAHCMYQLLALDWHAPEWEAALQPAAIGRS